LPYVCPDNDVGKTERRHDIFAFGVMLFVLLVKRFPHTHRSGLYLTPDDDERIFRLHANFKFDTLDPDAYPYFASIVRKCFEMEYLSGVDLLQDTEDAYRKWTERFQKVKFLLNF
jgi:hypothetical protein